MFEKFDPLACPIVDIYSLATNLLVHTELFHNNLLVSIPQDFYSLCFILLFLVSSAPNAFLFQCTFTILVAKMSGSSPAFSLVTQQFVRT